MFQTAIREAFARASVSTKISPERQEQHRRARERAIMRSNAGILRINPINASLSYETAKKLGMLGVGIKGCTGEA